MTSQDIAVEVSGLTIAFGNFKAVDNISFSVSRGEIFGFLGANGAGKTTTIRALCGLLTPTSGTMKVAGYSPEEGAHLIKSKIGYMSQKFTLYNDLGVWENIEFAANLRKMEPEILKKRADELFEFVGFKYGRETLVKNLPGGIKQQVALVASILHDPEIIFLDEPTAGVSPSERLRFWQLISQLAQSGKTIFITTHYMDEAEQCKRIALMQTGKIAALGSPEELKAAVFPEPMYEVEIEGDLPFNFSEEIQKRKIGEIYPFGMRYHLAVTNRSGWENLSEEFRQAIKFRQKKPTLEDVFIKVMARLQ